MLEAIPRPREEYNEFAPRVEVVPEPKQHRVQVRVDGQPFAVQAPRPAISILDFSAKHSLI